MRSKKTLSDVALERAREVQELAADPVSTRRRIYNGLAPIRQGDPQLALALEEHYLNRIFFLAEKAPKQPSYISPLRQKSAWKPSDAAASAFARYYAAAQSPEILIEEVEHARVAPETVEAVARLYPQFYDSFKEQATRQLMERTSELPYARRVAISKAFGLEALEPTLAKQFAQTFTGIIKKTSEGEEQDPDQKTGSRGGYQLAREVNSSKNPSKQTRAQELGG